MENVMEFDDRRKTRLAVMCFTPVLCFLACFIYYIFLVSSRANIPAADVGVLNENYDTLFIMLASSAIITAPIFIYCLVLLAKMKNLNGAMKLEWIVFLSVMAPIASAFFWVFLIKDAPRYVSMHPNIEAAHG